MIKTFKKYNPGSDRTEFEIVYDLKYNENKMLDFANGESSLVITIVKRDDKIINFRTANTTNHSFLWSSDNKPWNPSSIEAREIIDYFFSGFD